MIDSFKQTFDPTEALWDEEFDNDPDVIYLPSRAEIARQCAEIRRTWSDREHRKRSGGVIRLRWKVPIVHWETDISYDLSE